MSETLKFGNGEWATKEGSTLAYNDENGNFKPLPFTFDRSTSATRVNKEGLIEVVSNNEPRIDFLNDSKGALLLEPSRSNLITHSSDFNDASWLKTNLNITKDIETAPNGLLNASKILQTVSGGYARINTTLTGNETFSLFAKKGDLTDLKLFLGGDYAYFDLENGTILSETGSTLESSKIESFNDDWYRCSITSSYSGGSSIRFQGTDGTNDNSLGFIYTYGAQLEVGYPTSYIPTQGSIGTRVAEQGIDGGAGTPIFSNTSAVWFIDLERIGVDTDSSGSAMALRNSSFSQQIRLHFDAPTTNIRFRDGLNGFVTISTITGMSANVRKKIALRINGSALSTFANGSKIGSDYTAPSTFNIDEIDFATLGFKIHDMRFYNEILTDQELINLTKI